MGAVGPAPKWQQGGWGQGQARPSPKMEGGGGVIQPGPETATGKVGVAVLVLVPQCRWGGWRGACQAQPSSAQKQQWGGWRGQAWPQNNDREVRRDRPGPETAAGRVGRAGLALQHNEGKGKRAGPQRGGWGGEELDAGPWSHLHPLPVILDGQLANVV